MKITGIEPFAAQAGGRSFIFCVVDTDAGISGIGECGVNSRSQAILGAFDHIREQIVGEDASRIEHLWQVMYRGGFFPAGSVVGSALSAVDIALWDIARIGAGCSPTWPDPFFNRLRALCVIRRSAWAAPPSRPSEMVVT